MKEWKYMNRKTIAILLAILALILSACGALSKAKTSTIYVDKKGKVTSVTIASLPADKYNEEELKASIDEEILAYNGDEEKAKIKLNEFKVKKEQAILQITYATSDDYEAFNSRVLFTGTVAEAQAAGFDFAGEFLDTSKTAIKGSTIVKDIFEENVIITNEPVQVQTYKDIMYTSANATIVDKRIAQVESEAGATENGITFGNEENTYIIYGEPKE